MSGLSPGRPREPRDRLAASGRVLVAVLVCFALAGLVSGWVWATVATPETWLVLKGKAYPAQAGIERAFGQVGWFVVITGATGLLMGAVTAFLWRRFPLAATVGALVGGVASSVVAYLFGRFLGPGTPDPTGHQDYDALLGRFSLRSVDTDSPLLPFPDSTLLVGALAAVLALTVVYLVLPDSHAPARSERDGVPTPSDSGLWPPRPVRGSRADGVFDQEASS